MKILFFTGFFIFILIAKPVHANMRIVGKVTTLLTNKIENHTSHIDPKVDESYREFHPYFMDGCASGQKVHLNGDRGSALGHGSIFIKGACIDKSAQFPQVTMDCEPGKDEVGVSANGQFMNVNWVAIPNEKMFFNGEIEKDAVLDSAYRDQYFKKLADSGLFKNIKAKNTSTKEVLPGSDPAEYMRLLLLESSTLDFALTWGRQTVCQRVPMVRSQIERVVKFLNEKNQFYYVDGNTYDWNMWNNSCGHLAQNSFAAAGVMDEKQVDASGLSTVPNISVPSNFFYHLARLTSLDRYPSVRDVYRDPKKKKLLLEDGIIAQQAGVLSRYHGVHGADKPELNQLYNSVESKTGILSWNMFDQIGKKANSLFTEEKRYDLQENYESYILVYEKALRDAEEQTSRRHGREYKEVLEKYISHVKSQLALTQSRLLKLKGSPSL